MTEQPLMYADIAAWWPLLSPPQDYQIEADFFYNLFVEHSRQPPRTMLELGCGGGNNASFLKKHFQMTLVDISPGMLEVSRRLNPECEHALGDMRRVRFARRFDAVFVHDAIMYMCSEYDLLRTFETAATHLGAGGVAIFCPDCIKETFEPFTDHGGQDAEDGRGLRYLEWAFDPDPSDSTYAVDFAYLVRSSDGSVRSFYDRHQMGLFTRQTWLSLLRQAGFEPLVVVNPYEGETFIGVRQEDLG